MMNYDEAFEAVKDAINYMSIDEQFSIMCEYCDSNNYCDDMPYVCDEWTVDDLCSGLKPHDIIEKYRDIDFSWDYMVFTIYGVEEWVGIDYIDEVAEWILDTESDCGVMELESIIEEYNSEDDDEE